IVRCLNIERVADGIQRNNRQCRPVFSEPCILSSARQARHKRHHATVFLVRHVVQAAELVAVKQESSMIIGKGVWTVETPVLFCHKFPEVKILLRSEEHTSELQSR